MRYGRASSVQTAADAILFQSCDRIGFMMRGGGTHVLDRFFPTALIVINRTQPVI